MSGSERGAGRVLGSPGVYHYAAQHDQQPSSHYGNGVIVESLCGMKSGIPYSDDAMHNLFPEDRLCKWCARKATS